MIVTCRPGRLAIAAAAAVALVAALGGSSQAAPTTAGQDSRHTRLDHALIILLEDHSQQGVIGGNRTRPCITTLAQPHGEAASYHGVTHPSEPNKR